MYRISKVSQTRLATTFYRDDWFAVWGEGAPMKAIAKLLELASVVTAIIVFYFFFLLNIKKKKCFLFMGILPQLDRLETFFRRCNINSTDCCKF